MPESDPLHDALKDAVLATLLGSTSIPHQMADPQGNTFIGTINLPSVFAERIRGQVFSGKFDELIEAAFEKVDVEMVAKAIEKVLSESIKSGLQNTDRWSANKGWFENRIQNIAIAACTTAMKDDEELIDILRTKINAEVDRNRVGINVTLTDLEQ